MAPFLYASEADLVSALRTGDSSAFASLYDQYAPILLGIIAKTVGDEQRAAAVLAETFATVRSEIEFCPASQSLFLWLFDRARQTAANALAQAPKISHSALQLTPTGVVLTGTNRTGSVQKADNTQQRMLNAVLFERCTPQEASQEAGLPTENARQHLRQAFMQLRRQEA